MWTPTTERAAFLVDNLDLAEAAQFDGAVWEHFQLDHLQDDSTFRIEVKSRQIAASFLFAAEAVANVALYGISSLFQSISLDEAQEKIIYARRIYDNLQVRGLPRITQPDTTTALGFDNGARIMSLPGTPNRGKANFWVYLDEWAHQRYGRENYTAILPVITKGGKLRGASSPMGAGGMFWEIFSQSFLPFPGYRRKKTPWWEVQAFCTNVAEARKLAPSLTTFQRAEMFGNDRIKVIYANMPEEDFRQEYETIFVDETTAWITWEEIKANQAAHSGPAILSRSADSQVDNALDAIGELADLVEANQVELVFAAGYDVGRTRNTSELFLVGVSTLRSYPLRLAVTLDNCDFDSQLAVLTAALDTLPIFALLIDHNGIGRNLAESMEKAFPGKAAGVDFTNPSKTLWATDGKMLFQQRRVPLPTDKDIAYQVHSIKRMVTASKNLVFDTERNEKHHADKFWALMLALAAAIYVTAEPEPAGAITDETAVEISPY
jgi:phage FluMu gp28-like protein